MATLPSIAMIPAGYGTSKLYSQLPVDGTGDLTFSRGSTATRVNSSGLIEDVGANVPRLDYSDGSCPSLLLEPQSTNLSDISKVDTYSLSGTIIRTLNSGIGVTGLNDAVKLEKGSASAEYLNLRLASITLSASSDYTHSVFVKRDDVDFDFRLERNTSSNYGFSWNIDFTITSSGVTINSESNATGEVKRYGNGWYKVSATLTTSTPTTAITSYLFRLKASNGVGASVFIQDHQVEEQSYATSYIPTSGSTVTRLADSASKTGLSSYINSTEGVLFAEISVFDATSSGFYISVTDGTSNNRLLMGKDSGLATIRSYITYAPATQISMNGGNYTANTSFKIALKYKSGDNSLWVNGVEQDTDLLATMPTGLNQITLNSFQAKVKQLQVFDTALSDSELQSLTS